jgi:hypothetical protein
MLAIRRHLLAMACALLVACGGGGGSDSPGETPGPGADAPRLTLTRTGSGTVNSTPAGISCGATCSQAFDAGTQIALTAAPAGGYTFGGWTGGGCSGTGVCTLTLNADTFVMASFSPIPVAGTQYVPLTLASGPAAADVPVRTGLPFPKGALTSIDHLRLESADGTQEIPAQCDTLAHWPDGSIKVALVHLVTDLGNTRGYRVAYGPDVTRAALPNPIAVTGNPATEVMVETGPLRFSVSNKGLITRLWRDGDADGSFESAEQLIDAGDLFMVNAYNDQEYTASAATDAVVAIEEEGPLRAVIKAQGSLTGPGGATLLKYLIRYYASLGSDKVDIEVSVIDDRLEADAGAYPYPTTLAVSAKALGLRWHYLSDGAAAYRFGGEGGAVYAGTVSGEHYLLQSGLFNFIDGEDLGHTFTYSGVGTGDRAPGWVALDSGERHIALMVRDFWQQFPAELNIDGNELTAALFPARAVDGAADLALITPGGTVYRRPNTFYFNRTGGAKTYQLRLALGDQTPTTADLGRLNESFQRHRLELLAELAWYTASGVFGELNVGGSSTADTGYDASLMRDIYEASIERTDGNATMFGWRDYGDRLRAGWDMVVNGLRIPSFYNDTHVGSNNFFKQFLRSGDPRWFQLAEISTRHFMDLDVHHAARQGYWATGGRPQPAGELKGSAHSTVDHEGRNLHWGHAHVSGLSDLYLLTGDKRSLEVLAEIAGWWEFVTPYFFQLPFANTGPQYAYREAERDYAWPLYVMNEWVRVTGDAEYHQNVAAHLVNYLIQWWQTPLAHIGYNATTGVVSNAVLGVNDASNGTGYWTMTRMDNYGTADQATGANPWMAGPLISNIIKFYEQDKAFAAVGDGSGVNHALLREMLFQCMNYIVKHGYDTSRDHLDYDYFVYSETMREYDGGDHHIIYGLAYLERLFLQESALGSITHPGWYDTRPLWGAIAARRYDELRSMAVGSTQSYGFYGYEIVYPPDFFRIMSGE